MSDIKIVDWPKRPAEQRRDELERENAELRKLVQQMKCCANCNGRLWAATGKGDCPKCKDFDKWTPQQPEAAEKGRGMNINDFIDKYCNFMCDKGGQIDCSVSLDGTCAKSRQLKIEIEGANGD